MVYAANDASDAHLDLSRAPYVLDGIKYIDLVCPAPANDAGGSHLDLSRAPYCDIDLASLAASALKSNINHDLSRAPYALYGVKYTASYPVHSLQAHSLVRPVSCMGYTELVSRALFAGPFARAVL